MYVYPREYRYGIFQDITVDSTNTFFFDSTNLTPITGDFEGLDVQSVEIRVEDNDIRYRLDGQGPTDGTLLQELESVTIRGYGNISDFRAIAVSGPAKLKTHFGYGGSSSKPK